MTDNDLPSIINDVDKWFHNVIISIFIVPDIGMGFINGRMLKADCICHLKDNDGLSFNKDFDMLASCGFGNTIDNPIFCHGVLLKDWFATKHVAWSVLKRMLEDIGFGGKEYINVKYWNSNDGSEPNGPIDIPKTTLIALEISDGRSSFLFQLLSATMRAPI